jgi:hypothetical protein
MAPTNEYLADPEVQERLAKHDNRLIKLMTVRFPGEAPEEHCDFNRPREFELLAGYLDRFSDIDFRDGRVTVTEAARATYGVTDNGGYLDRRIVGILAPSSVFNQKHFSNGQCCRVDDQGRIIRDDRERIAIAALQEAADWATRAAVRAATSGGKHMRGAERRARKIAPASSEKLRAIASEARSHIVDQAQLALGQGD